MKNPKIMDITLDKIIENIKAKSPFFVPEWQPDEKDPGFALVKIFAEMYYSIIERLNLAPLKHYLNFLEMLDIKLLLPQPAKAPVVFMPVKGVLEDIIIPVSTKVAGKDSEEEPVIFETQTTFVITPSKLCSVFSILPETDCIYKQNELIDGKKPEQIFTGKNFQTHMLYIGDSDIFNIKEGKIVLAISGKRLDLLASEYVRWEYVPDKKDNSENKWEGIFCVRKNGKYLTLEKKEENSIKEIEVNGIKNRWIRCRLINSKKEFSDVEINRVSIVVEPSEKIDLSKKIPVKNIYGIGDIFSKKLHKRNINFADELISFSPLQLSKILNCPFHRAENILEAAKKAFYDKTGVQLEEYEKIAGIVPDFVFVNDVPVNPADFYPFGLQPKIYDTCYIGSEEVFSKKDYQIALKFYLTPGSSSSEKNVPQISWEYWDGEAWINFGIKEIFTSGNAKKIEIPKLPEIKKTIINGKENYWIRIRLVGGDYGREYEIKDREVKQGGYNPPRIEKFRLIYSGKEKLPQNILIENNLQIEQPEYSFRPFKFLKDKYSALYFCFDLPLKRGPYSMYIDIDKYYAYPENEKPPIIKWEYYGEDGWRNLDVVDETKGLTRSGILKFYLEEETAPFTLFDIEKGYWIRAVITDTFWDLKNLSKIDPYFPLKPFPDLKFTPHVYIFAFKKIISSFFDKHHKDYKEKPLIIGDFAKVDIKMLPPVINGIYLNATMTLQVETIEDEILGSASGQPNESFKTLKSPVIDETLWVNEINALSDTEKKQLKKFSEMIKEEYDEDGNLINFWVKWKAVDNFIDSTPLDRHYIIDRVSGEIIFGDGKRGKIPPAGNDNIKISYKTGGGKKGNLSAQKIKELHSPISFIEGVYNPVASSGGCDTENIESLIKRGSKVLRHRNRAITIEDYYDLVFESSREIAKVKIINRFDQNSPYKNGDIVIVIVPHSNEIKPLATSILKEQVKNYIEKRASNLVKIHVKDPLYIKVNVQVELTTKKIDKIPFITSQSIQKIKKFLNPLTGGKEKTGWDFGVIPCLSDIYALVQRIDDVEYVNNISMVLISEDGKSYVIYSGSLKYVLPEYALIYPGDVDVKVNLL